MDYEKKKYETEDLVNHVTVHWASGPACYSTNTEYKILDLFTRMSNFKGGSVLEVGPGRGKFANLLLNNYPITSYTCLDLQKNFKDSQGLLEGRVNYVESKDYEQVWHKPYSLFVATFVISEVPDYYRDNIYAHVIPNCDNVFIIDGDNNSKLEGFYDFNTHFLAMIGKNFGNVRIEDSGMHSGMAVAASK